MKTDIPLIAKISYSFSCFINRMKWKYIRIKRNIFNPRPSHKLEEIGYRIADFYLKRHPSNLAEDYGFDYEAARQEVESLRIHKLSLNWNGNKLTIHTSRPGLLIGRKGKDINALSEHLGLKLDIFEVKWTWNDILVPQPPFDWE